MKSVARRHISRAVSIATGLSYADVTEIVNQSVKVMIDSLAAGNVVQLRGFGTFEFRERMAKIRHNPRNPSDRVEVPRHFAVIFKPCNTLKRAVRRLPEVMATRSTFAARRSRLRGVIRHQ